jgi:3-hydroxyisobutyrate dehydrogenase
MSSNIGFVGLGNMGLPMAINLAKKNHKVFAFDVDPKRSEDCKANNITFRNNIGDLAKDANIFVTMLPNSQHSIDVCQTKEGGKYVLI